MLRRNSDPGYITFEDVSNYVVLGQIGVGTVSTVYKAENTSVPFHSPLRCIAFKRIVKTYENIGKQESLVLTQLKHCDNVVNYFGTYTLHGELVLAMELLDYNREFSLYSRPVWTNNFNCDSLDAFQDGYKAFAKVSVQLLTAVTEMHNKGLVHCDLKPENILYQPGHNYKIKLIDFGNTIWEKDIGEYCDSFELQSVAYRAPEVVLGDSTMDRKIDVWSVGVILLELYVNSLFMSHSQNWRLIHSVDRRKIVETLMNKFGSLDMYSSRGKFWDRSYAYSSRTKDSTLFLQSLLKKDPHEYNRKIVNFLYRLLQVDHTKRCSAEEALRHPFLVSTLLGSWGRALSNGKKPPQNGGASAEGSATQNGN